MTSETPDRTHIAPGYLATIAGLALAGGAIEALVLFIRVQRNPMTAVSDDFAWSVPLALLLTSLLAALPLAIAARLWPRLAPIAIFAGLAIVFLDLVFLIPRLSQLAAAILAAGLAMQATRLIRANPVRWHAIARWAGALAFITAAVLWIAQRRGSTPEQTLRAAGETNVLLITLDTVRAQSLSLYGHHRPTSSRLAQVGSQGAVFELAFATAPWTLPSHASLFTGWLPYDLGADYYSPMNQRYATLAELFTNRGYRTAGFAANLGYVSRGTGLGRGFEDYEDYPRALGQFVSNSTILRKLADNFTLRRWLANDEHLNRVTADNLNARFFRWLDAKGYASFFAFLNYFDAHEPYLPPPPFERKFGAGRLNGKHSPLHHAQWNPAWPSRELTAEQLREEQDAYDEAIAYLDDRIGALMDGLAQRGLLDQTLIVITSDHGEEFAEHRVLEHGYSMYRAGLQVPLLMRLPSRVPAVRIKAPVSLVDVAATIAEIAGGQSARMPGHSLSAHWKDPGTAARPVISALTRPPGYLPEWYPIAKGDMHSVIWRGFHWILNGDGTEELYDLAHDPDERTNLASRVEHAALLAEMRAHLGNARTRRP